MNTLTLIISSDWPQDRRECHWHLQDARGRIVQKGYSDPAHWPGVLREGDGPRAVPLNCHLLLAGVQVACHCAELPRTARARSPELMAVAIEEQVLDDPTDLLFTCSEPPQGEKRHAVGVVSRSRLEALVRVVSELGLVPVSAWPLGDCIPHQSALVSAGDMTWRRTGGAYCGAVVDSSLPLWLPEAGATEASRAMSAFRYTVLEQGVLAAATDVLGHLEARGILERVAPDTIPIQIPMTSGFLYGELAPTRSRHILNGIVRPLARLAAGLTLTLLLLALAQWMWLALKTDGYRNEIAGLFRESFPKAAMVDPLLQMRRQVAQARRAAGQLAGGDFLYLIEPLTELPSGGVRAEEVSFENGRLRVKANFSNEAMERLKALGPQHGISLVIDSIQVSGDRQVASISLVEGAAR